MERLTCWTRLVVLAVFLCHLQMSTACSCVYMDSQTMFCQSDFVSLVTVEDVERVHEGRYTTAYKVHVIETFKATPSIQVVLEQKPVRIWTYSGMGGCGRTGLKPGDTWVLGGAMDGSRHLQVSICGFAHTWADVTPDQLANLRQSYLNGCA